MLSECADVVKWCDISLNSQGKTLRKLNECAGEQDKSLFENINVTAGSSDHTVLAVTDSSKIWKTGDTMDFSLYYMGLL